MPKTKLYQWLRLQPLGIRNKAVLSKLCNYANNNTYEAGVRVGDLAVEVGCSDRTIQSTLRELEALELISSTGRRKRLHSGGLLPIYRVAPELQVPEQGAKSAPTSKPFLHPMGRNCFHPNKQEGIILSKEKRERLKAKSPLPVSIRRHFVEDRGEDYTSSYIDRCEWNPADKSLQPHSSHAHERIRFESGLLLRRLGIKVIAAGTK